MKKQRLNSKLTYENPFVLRCHSIVHAPLPPASPLPPLTWTAQSTRPAAWPAARSRWATLPSTMPMPMPTRATLPAAAMHRAPVAVAGYRSGRIRRRRTCRCCCCCCVVYPAGQWMRQGAAGCCSLDVSLVLLLLLPASLGQVAERVPSGLVYCPLQCSFGRGRCNCCCCCCCRSTVAPPPPPSLSAAKEVYEKSIKKVFNQSHCLG